MSRDQSGIRKTGSFYTPWELAYAIAGQTLQASLNTHLGLPLEANLLLKDARPSIKTQALEHLSSVTVLDPAVGDGVFLLASAEWLEKAHKALGSETPASELRRSIVTKNLYGVDIRPEAINECCNALACWSGVKDSEELESRIRQGNILHGNSLIGWTHTPEECDRWEKECFDDALQLVSKLLGKIIDSSNLQSLLPLHWPVEFPQFIQSENPGFDIVIGNPPYGNILSNDERVIISKTRKVDISASQDGTWNIAALFIARAQELMKSGAHLGFLIPNSVLRTRQFLRVRQLLLTDLTLWKIIDEASPFSDVTLEMVTVFCQNLLDTGNHLVTVESRRPGIDWKGTVPWSVLKTSRVFPIYYDAILEKILKRSTRGWARATRGRDIPMSNIRRKANKEFSVPYATSGRSVKRYRLDSNHLIYTDFAFLSDSALKESYENEMLVATKNYPYPRCVIKPKGVVHGGGLVQIIPLHEGFELEALGLILNSRLVQYMCVKYLTNYSQLTTCLNTGIMEDLPIVMPKEHIILAHLFRKLQDLYGRQGEQANSNAIAYIEKICNGIVYQEFLLDSSSLLAEVSNVIGEAERIGKKEFEMLLASKAIRDELDLVMKNPLVLQIEESPRM